MFVKRTMSCSEWPKDLNAALPMPNTLRLQLFTVGFATSRPSVEDCRILSVSPAFSSLNVLVPEASTISNVAVECKRPGVGLLLIRYYKVFSDRKRQTRSAGKLNLVCFAQTWGLRNTVSMQRYNLLTVTVHIIHERRVTPKAPKLETVQEFKYTGNMKNCQRSTAPDVW